MITVQFSADSRGNIVEVSVRGHALYAAYGEDIVCASVTSALQLTINGITEVLGVNAAVQVEENLIRCKLPHEKTEQSACDFLKALELHLNILQETYPQTIELTYLEV